MSAHMAEHVLLVDVVPLLAVLGLTRPVLAPVLRASRLHVLAHPAVALAIWIAVLGFWHLPVAYDWALASDAGHAAQHATFLGAGLLAWGALLGPLPKPAWFGAGARMGYLVGIWLVGAVIGSALVFSGTAFYETYRAALGASAAADQSTAGAIMMVEQSTLVVVLFCRLFLDAFRESGERQELRELAAARGIVLDEERIARAVSAGRAAALQERLLRERGA